MTNYGSVRVRSWVRVGAYALESSANAAAVPRAHAWPIGAPVGLRCCRRATCAHSDVRLAPQLFQASYFFPCIFVILTVFTSGRRSPAVSRGAVGQNVVLATPGPRGLARRCAPAAQRGVLQGGEALPR